VRAGALHATPVRGGSRNAQKIKKNVLIAISKNIYFFVIKLMMFKL